MKVLLNLCLLFGLISPVMLLKCKKCVTLYGTKCPQEVDQNCPPDSACSTIIYSSNVFLNRKIARKSCTPSASCAPGEYSVTTSGGGFLRMLVDCCTTNNCNSKNLKFSSQPMEPNGLECEGCHAEGQGTCEGAEMVKCLGDQTQCISMKIIYVVFGPLQARAFSTKGCATPLMCDNQKVNKNMVLGLIGVNSVIGNCTDAILPPSVPSLA